MNSPPHPERVEPLVMTRREAIRRTALALGIAVTPSLLHVVARAQAAAGASTPVYFTPAQFAVAAAIAERILPRTNTPGAADVGVPAFLDLMYGEYLTPDEQRAFAAGLAEVEPAAAAFSPRGFPHLTPEQQDDVLRRIAVAAQDQEKTFFHAMKELVLLGYFTSEPIGRNVLHYDPIPGRFEGCIPLAEVGNISWTQ